MRIFVVDHCLDPDLVPPDPDLVPDPDSDLVPDQDRGLNRYPNRRGPCLGGLNRGGLNRGVNRSVNRGGLNRSVLKK